MMRYLDLTLAAAWRQVAVVAALTGAVAAPASTSLRGASRERVSFNDGWLFQKGEPAGLEDVLGYERLKPWLVTTGADLAVFPAAAPEQPAPGADVPLVQPGFDDHAWRRLDLPHDWGIEGPFDPALPGATGKLPWAGVGWYRKHFAVAAADQGRRVYLDVDGAMSYATVWLNGRLVGGWPYGYASWRVDLTPHLNFGGENVLAIRLDNPPDSSRWYPGGGLYRNVWLVKTAPVHVAHWGIYVTTPQVTPEAATVDVRVTIDQDGAAAATFSVGTEIYEMDRAGRPAGAVVAAGAPVSFDRVRAGTPVLTSLTHRIDRPKRWSPRSPQRYLVVTTVIQDGVPVDVVETPFGIRTLEFTPDRGFLLNGERLALQGVCNHHDLGALGSAINVRALQRQLEILQAMGANAIRTSHNPPAPELLELCDRMGFLVMDEAFDCWRSGKTRNDYHRVFADWHEQDLRALVRRDRNHPSVVLWSIGNEIREQGEPGGAMLAAHLAGIVREEDRTRPVTAGFNNIGSGYNGFQHVVDVFGYNYKPDEYAPFHARNPAIPLYSSESSSCISSRGEYFFPVVEDKAQGQADFQMSSYDLYAPRWAWPPDVEWRGLDRNPFTLGEFVWTGFDYLGEPTPYNRDATNLLNFTDPQERARMEKELAELGRIAVPSRSSYFGIVDLAGFPKDRYYLYQSRWRPDLPMAHLLPHWTWPERVGQVTPVFVYSSADEAELFLNGRSLGRRRRGEFEYRFRWDDVVYAPGELKVQTWKAGRPWAEAVQRTAGAPAKLALQADRATLQADGRDLAFVTLSITDASGTLAPRADNEIRFSVSGPGEIVATDNGDATSQVVFSSPVRAAFNGLALVIVRPRRDATGTITLRAESDGLPAAEITLTSVAAP